MGMFDNFLAELQKTLGGGPGKEGRGDVGAFEQGAIAGGKNVLGLPPASSGPQVNPIDLNEEYVRQNTDQGPPLSAAEHLSDVRPTPQDINQFFSPQTINAIDLNKDYALQNQFPDSGLPPPDRMMPLPSPDAAKVANIAEPGAPTKLASRARQNSGRTPAALKAAMAEQSELVAPAKAQAKDPIVEALLGNRSKAENDQANALAAAKAAENMSDDEKLAFALLGALPALAGLIGGAAVGGGQGAVAGLAGGLSGGAQGMQSIADNKKAKRKELLAQAEKAGDRAAKIDDQSLAHAEALQEQGFRSGEYEKGRKFEGQKLDKELSFRGREGSLNRATELQKTRMNIFGDLEGKRITADSKGAGKPLGDADKNFYANASTAMQNLDALEKLVGGKGGTNWSPASNPFADPKMAGQLNQMLYDTAVAYAKIVDPASAAREGEVESILKNALPVGATVSPKTSIEAFRHMKQLIRQKAAARGELGVPIPPEARQQAAPPTAPVQPGASGGKLKDILGF